MHVIKMKLYILFVAQLYHFYADIYSLEYSGILYMFICPILVSMASLLTSCNNIIMQNTPLKGTVAPDLIGLKVIWLDRPCEFKNRR